MPLGKEVGLGPGHVVLDGDPAPTAAPPHFRPCLLWPNGRPSQQLLKLLSRLLCFNGFLFQLFKSTVYIVS